MPEKDKDKKKYYPQFVMVPSSKPKGGGVEQIQTDWNQFDSTAKDYLKNKPFDVPQIESLLEDETIPYDEESGNTKTLDEAIFTLADVGKVIKVDIDGDVSEATITEVDGTAYAIFNADISDMSVIDPEQNAFVLVGDGDELFTYIFVYDHTLSENDIIINVYMDTGYTKLDGNKIKVDGETIKVDEYGQLYADVDVPSITVDDALSMTSENPVQNKVITNAIGSIIGYPPDPSQITVNLTFQPPINPNALGLILSNDGINYHYWEYETHFYSDNALQNEVFDVEYKGMALSNVNNLWGPVYVNKSGSTRYGKSVLKKYSTGGELLGTINGNTETMNNNGAYMLNTTYNSPTYSSNNVALINTVMADITLEYKCVGYDVIRASAVYNIINYTVNGDIPKTPWQLLSEKVNDLLCTKTADGTYQLQATVTNSVVTYEWVSIT